MFGFRLSTVKLRKNPAIIAMIFSSPWFRSRTRLPGASRNKGGLQFGNTSISEENTNTGGKLQKCKINLPGNLLLCNKRQPLQRMEAVILKRDLMKSFYRYSFHICIDKRNQLLKIHINFIQLLFYIPRSGYESTHSHIQAYQ
jgi:hypothetical protein